MASHSQYVDLQTPSSFDATGDASSLGARWKRWKKTFEYFLEAKGISTPKQARALLLYSAGQEVQDIFENLTDPGHPAGVDPDPHDAYQKAMRTLDAHFSPKMNVPYERHKFRQMSQSPTETVDQFVARLRKQGANCEFEDKLDENIRDQVIDRCSSTHLRRKLLQKGTELTLPTLQELARAMEAVDMQAKAMSEAQSKVPSKQEEVNRVEDRSKEKKSGQYNRRTRPRDRHCYRCGNEGHFARDPECPARQSTCGKCHLQGHYATMCRTKIGNEKKEGGKPQGAMQQRGKGQQKKSRVNMVEDDAEDDDEYAFAINTATDSEGTVTAVLNGGHTVPNMLIDSGTTCNIVNRSTWNQLKQKGFPEKLTSMTKKLYSYGSEQPLPCLGKFQAQVQVANQETWADFIVIDGTDRALLGRHTAQELGILKLGSPTVHTIRTSTAVEVEDNYADCFDKLGKLKGYQARIHVDESVKPVAQNTRRIPFSLRGKLEKKLEELVNKDVIEPVEGPTPWVSPVVIVPKPSGDIRLCVDMRRANTAVLRERHPIPTIDEVLQAMNGSTIFTKLDLKWGFHQIELEEDSRAITCFCTHKGLFRYKRLMFGISSAPELY